MGDRSEDWFSAVAGLVAVVAVGLSAVLADAGGTAGDATARLVFWTAYILFVAAFVVDAELVGGTPGHTTRRLTLAVLVVAGSAAVLADPDMGWSPVLLVVTVATAAHTWPTPVTATIVAVQSAVVATAAITDGWAFGELVLATVVYASFQSFAVLVVNSQRRALDATERLAAAHAELRGAHALLAVSTRAAERLRISRDLHDVIGHQLTALALQLEVAAHACARSDALSEAGDHVGRARTIARELLDDVRQVVGELRTPRGGIETLLRPMVSDLPGPHVELRVDERAALSESQQIAVVRCVQEIVTNTLRHANAGRLQIDLTVDDGEAHLSAVDDGRGAPHVVTGNGLVGLTERVAELGGTTSFRTAPGGGFSVDVRMPVP